MQYDGRRSRGGQPRAAHPLGVAVLQQAMALLAEQEIAMKLILKSGTVIEDSSCDVATWKEVLKSPTTVQYSTGKGEVILFNSSEIREIRFSAEDVERSMQNVVS